MRIALILLAALFITNLLRAESAQGWDYQYNVHAAGTKSESITGKLLYKDKELPEGFTQVVTPIGEFLYDPRSMSEGSPLHWIPGIASPNQKHTIATLACTEKEVKQYQSGLEPAYRKCTIPGEIKEVSNEACIAGKFEERPKEAGADWFYVVKQGLWVNPQKMDEVLKMIFPTPPPSPAFTNLRDALTFIDKALDKEDWNGLTQALYPPFEKDEPNRNAWEQLLSARGKRRLVDDFANQSFPTSDDTLLIGRVWSKIKFIKAEDGWHLNAIYVIR